MNVDKVLANAEQGFQASMARLFTLLRIPSISTDPAYKQHCSDAAGVLVADLKAMGFDAAARPTGGHPMIVAHYKSKSSTAKTPHVLFYGHFYHAVLQSILIAL